MVGGGGGGGGEPLVPNTRRGRGRGSARLTREDEVSELRIVAALFRTLASGQQHAVVHAFVIICARVMRGTRAPFITSPPSSRGGLTAIFVIGDPLNGEEGGEVV